MVNQTLCQTRKPSSPLRRLRSFRDRTAVGAAAWHTHGVHTAAACAGVAPAGAHHPVVHAVARSLHRSAPHTAALISAALGEQLRRVCLFAHCPGGTDRRATDAPRRLCWMVSRALASLQPCVLQALPMLISALGAVRCHALRGHARPQSRPRCHRAHDCGARASRSGLRLCDRLPVQTLKNSRPWGRFVCSCWSSSMGSCH